MDELHARLDVRAASSDIIGFERLRRHHFAKLVAEDIELGAPSRPVCSSPHPGRVVDSSSNFLGNLAPRLCTVQRCSNRARGRLLRLVSGRAATRDVWSLHNRDVEWLVTNFLFSQRICAAVWSGSRSYEDIDHAGQSPTGREVLAQTTVSRNFVEKKAARLLGLRTARRDLLLFGPESAREQCPSGIKYQSIEDVFSTIDTTPAGRWLVNRMLAVTTK